MNVRKMIKEMGSRSQLLDWLAFEEDEPFGERRADYHAAQIVAALINVHRNTKKFPELIPVANFLIQFGQNLREVKPATRPKKDWRELKAIAKVMSQIYNEENDRAAKRAEQRSKRPVRIRS